MAYVMVQELDMVDTPVDSEGKIASAGSFIDMGKIDPAVGPSAAVGKPWVVTLDMCEGFKLTLQRG